MFLFYYSSALRMQKNEGETMNTKLNDFDMVKFLVFSTVTLLSGGIMFEIVKMI